MDDAEASSIAGVLLGTLSLTTIYSKILEYAGPRLMSTLGLDVNFLVMLAVLCFAIVTGGTYLRDGAKTLLHDYYSCTVQVASQDPLFSALMTFLDEEGAFNMSQEGAQETQIEQRDTEVNEKSRVQKKKKGEPRESNVRPGGRDWALSPLFTHTTRHIEANLKDWRHYSHDIFDDYHSESESSESEAEDSEIVRNRKKIKYAPARSCEDYFYYKPTGNTITIIRDEIPNSQSGWWNPRPKQQVQLTIYGKDPTPLKMLLDEVVERQNSKEHGRTAVYKARQGSEGGGTGAEWTRCFSKPVRSLDTVILDDTQKKDISEDLKEFLLPATNKWYSNRGLPYRRGYLLYGPPGTGKTSLSVALAGKFGLSVYALSLSVAWMNDDTLAQLFSSLPKNCIVLLEDIDACGVTREKGAADKGGDAAPPKPLDKNSTSNAKQVSFSGLLNAIDGVASKEGRALIMTTNHRERLDEALIRPGRVDVQIKFAYADKKIIHGLFRAIYEVNEIDKRILKFPKDFPDDDEIADLANVFAGKVPEHVFSPAEVQGFLLKHKKNPRRAVVGVAVWAEQALLEKKEKEEKEKEKEEKERVEKEKMERKERRKRAKEEREKREKREKRLKEGKRSSDDDTDTEDEEEDNEVHKEVTKLTNGDSVANGINGKTVNGIVGDEVKVT